jgi:hypothetical protein
LDDQIFSDGIGTITVIGATVRVDFVALSPTEREPNGQPKAVFKQRIVMGVDGFLRSAGKVQEAVQALSKMGAVQQASGMSAVAAAVSGKPEEQANDIAPMRNAEAPAAQRSGAMKPPFP